MEVELLNAVSNGYFREMQNLLKKGVNVNATVEGCTLLHIAILREKYKCAQLLISYGINIDVLGRVNGQYYNCPNFLTPLQLVLHLGHMKFTRLLIENNVNPHLYSHDGLAAIHLAVLKSVPQNLRYVLFKADVNYPAKQAGHEGWTALHFAIHMNLHTMADILLDNNADITCKAENGLIPLQLIRTSEMWQMIFNHSRFKDEMLVFQHLAEKGIDFNAKIHPATKSLFLLAHEFGKQDDIQSMSRLGAVQENTLQWNFETLHMSMSGMTL